MLPVLYRQNTHNKYILRLIKNHCFTCQIESKDNDIEPVNIFKNVCIYNCTYYVNIYIVLYLYVCIV